MATNKVILNGEVVLDLTQDSVEPQFVMEGVTFHGKDGEKTKGTMKPYGAPFYDGTVVVTII